MSSRSPVVPAREIPARSVDVGDVDVVLERVAGSLRGTTASRERDRTSLQAQARALIDDGFGTLRIPVALGGVGASLEDLIRRLIDLAAVDSNLAHIFRGHIGFVESLHVAGLDESEYARRWARRLVDERLLFGNAQSERTSVSAVQTRLSVAADALVLDGVKYYTTGSIHADWIQLSALATDGETVVNVLVDARQAGVESVDDWDGFGQVLTGSGTTRFTAAVVDARDVRGDDAGADGDSAYIAAVFQLVLLAVLAGIAQAALDDTIAFVRDKRRIFGFSGETLARENTLVQSVVGRLSASAHAARALVLSGAASLDRALDSARSAAHPEERDRILRQALLDVFRLQQVVPDLVLDATTELFEVGGASAVSSDRALDRHWRNARTVFSHNPALQRRRTIGEFELNGTFTPWQGAIPAPETERAAVSTR